LNWKMIGNQCPGVWLTDTVNNLRFVVSTSASIPACGGGATETPDSCIATVSVPTANTNILEYADLNNVPIGKWFQLTATVMNRHLELYLNGELTQTTILRGTPVFNNNDGQFVASSPFNGRLANFRYMPHSLPIQAIRELYEKESKLSFLRIKNPTELT